MFQKAGVRLGESLLLGRIFSSGAEHCCLGQRGGRKLGICIILSADPPHIHLHGL